MFFFFKQKTAYEMRISDWSSDVCSSDRDAQGAMLPEYSRDPCRPGGEAVPVAGGDRYQRGVDIAGAACGPLARAIIDDGCEAAVDHATDVEGHLGAHRLHARSEEPRRGKGGVSTCKSLWSQTDYKQ